MAPGKYNNEWKVLENVYHFSACLLLKSFVVGHILLITVGILKFEDYMKYYTKILILYTHIL
jgi:hypothetical protein